MACLEPHAGGAGSQVDGHSCADPRQLAVHHRCFPAETQDLVRLKEVTERGGACRDPGAPTHARHHLRQTLSLGSRLLHAVSGAERTMGRDFSKENTDVMRAVCWCCDSAKLVTSYTSPLRSAGLCVSTGDHIEQSPCAMHRVCRLTASPLSRGLLRPPPCASCSSPDASGRSGPGGAPSPSPAQRSQRSG